MRVRRVRGVRDLVRVLSVDDEQAVERGDLAHGRLDLRGRQRWELVDAGVQQEALEPEHARLVQRAQLRDVARDGPPQKPTSTHVSPSAALRLTSSAATSTVGGMLLSGMSTMVVTPPDAAALVAVSNPSHSVRPGSLTCTCESTRPGSSTSSVSSSTTAAARSPRPDPAPRPRRPGRP
jgi:hypothetical protein